MVYWLKTGWYDAGGFPNKRRVRGSFQQGFCQRAEEKVLNQLNDSSQPIVVVSVLTQSIPTVEPPPFFVHSRDKRAVTS